MFFDMLVVKRVFLGLISSVRVCTLLSFLVHDELLVVFFFFFFFFFFSVLFGIVITSLWGRGGDWGVGCGRGDGG